MYTTCSCILYEKKQLKNLQKEQLQKKIIPAVNVSMAQIASINVLIPWDNWKTLFLIKVYC